MDREEKRRLLGYLVEKVVRGDGGVSLYLRSETLEAPKVNHPEGTYPPGGEWLPPYVPPPGRTFAHGRHKKPPRRTAFIWLPLADLNCGPSD